MTVKNKFFLLALLLFSTSIVSENLNDIYQLALSNAPQLKSAEATYRAGKESKKQGIAGLLPSLNVTGTTNWNAARIEDTLIDEYNSNSYSGVISQPLFRLDKWFKFKQKSLPLQQTKELYKKRKKFSEKEFKEFSILFLVMNYLDIFRKNIELISEVTFCKQLLNEFKKKLIDYLLLEKFFAR